MHAASKINHCNSASVAGCWSE